ncbi:Helix-turn-helix [Epibacterium ulvae]|uniref:Helix-turn-helix n=1 Tax=Epibacterium ulvae TaxID=1156985 RepID=A0A1G5RHQ6_9RHOB|nr:helix-turn-helix domain-containing protein [Epibacterium ulvae]SCZ73350.1 Helix-turn-helix [Epibacterium ulvae]
MTPDQVLSIREALDLTQAELASVMGYGKAVRVSELERGARKPSPAAERLLKAYAAGYRPDDWPKVVSKKGADNG